MLPFSRNAGARGGPTGARVERDLDCASCGYNVRGLTWGGACPECGATIQSRSALRDSLLAGGATARLRWAIGLGLAAACVAAAMVGYVVNTALSVAGLVTTREYALFGALDAVLWVTATWLVTPKAITEGRPWMRSVRVAARGLSLLWIVGYACVLLRVLRPSLVTGFEHWIRAGDLLGRLGGGVGVLFVAFILSFLASEAELERAERRLNAAVWLLWFPTLLMQAFPAQMAWFTLVPLGFVVFIWCWLLILMVLGLLELRAHVRWAGVLARESADRLRRIEEHRRSIDAEVASTVRPPPVAEGEVEIEP